MTTIFAHRYDYFVIDIGLYIYYAITHARRFLDLLEKGHSNKIQLELVLNDSNNLP